MVSINFACLAAGLTLLGSTLMYSRPTHAAPEASAASRACIQRVLAEDDRLAQSRNHAPETAPIDKAVRTYADAIDVLDYTGCPAAFVAVFRAHVAAWRATLPLLQRHAARRGEMHVLFEAISADPAGQDLPAYETVIWKTWAEVERAAQD